MSGIRRARKVEKKLDDFKKDLAQQTRDFEERENELMSAIDNLVGHLLEIAELVGVDLSEIHDPVPLAEEIKERVK